MYAGGAYSVRVLVRVNYRDPPPPYTIWDLLPSHSPFQGPLRVERASLTSPVSRGHWAMRSLRHLLRLGGLWQVWGSRVQLARLELHPEESARLDLGLGGLSTGKPLALCSLHACLASHDPYRASTAAHRPSKWWPHGLAQSLRETEAWER